MKSLVLLLAVVLQQPQPFEGTLAQGLKRVEELALAGKKDEALALSEQLARSRTGRESAAVEYARGVVHAGAQEREPAAEAFQRARADGAGVLRLASMYNLGTLALEQGEEWYHKLPEVSGKPVPAQPPAGASAPGQPPGPDALVEARKGYLAARERLVERLRAQWDDPDTRANVELVQRRLKRLDEIEKQRKEEQQKQQQQKQDSKNDKQQQDKQDKQDPGKPKDDPEKQDPQQQQQPAQDPQDKDKPEEQKPDQPKPEDQKQPGEKDQPQPKPAEEQQLSKEEMTRLLDKLQQLEEQAAKLRAQIHKARRVAVKKDW